MKLYIAGKITGDPAYNEYATNKGLEELGVVLA